VTFNGVRRESHGDVRHGDSGGRADGATPGGERDHARGHGDHLTNSRWGPADDRQLHAHERPVGTGVTITGTNFTGATRCVNGVSDTSTP